MKKFRALFETRVVLPPHKKLLDCIRDCLLGFGRFWCSVYELSDVCQNTACNSHSQRFYSLVLIKINILIQKILYYWYYSQIASRTFNDNSEHLVQYFLSTYLKSYSAATILEILLGRRLKQGEPFAVKKEFKLC